MPKLITKPRIVSPEMIDTIGRLTQDAWTQKEIAMELDISPSTVARFQEMLKLKSKVRGKDEKVCDGCGKSIAPRWLPIRDAFFWCENYGECVPHETT